MGKLDKLKSQIPQGSQELSTKNHLAKTEIAMSFQNEGIWTICRRNSRWIAGLPRHISSPVPR